MNNLSTTASTTAPAYQGGPSEAVVTYIREFLAFKLGDEEYGMDILRVQEIRSFEQPTRMANAQPFILGVINLRGVIVPIIDLRIRFSLDKVTYDALTVVIVINVGAKVVGMVVDGVSDVITFKPEQLNHVPEFTSTVGSDHLLAIGSVGDRMLMLLDIEALMASPDMGLNHTVDLSPHP